MAPALFIRQLKKTDATEQNISLIKTTDKKEKI